MLNHIGNFTEIAL